MGSEVLKLWVPVYNVLEKMCTGLWGLHMILVLYLMLTSGDDDLHLDSPCRDLQSLSRSLNLHELLKELPYF